MFPLTLKGKPAECRTVPPDLVPLKTQPDHIVACHFREESQTLVAPVLPTAASK